MSPRSFFDQVAADARMASSRTGVPVSVILAQWAIETGYGTSRAWLKGNNYAGVSPGGRLADYPTRTDGLAAYIATLQHRRYDPIRHTSSAHGAAVALGQSPWAESHYGGDGRQLIQVMDQWGLSQYDTGTGPAGVTVQPVGIPSPGNIIDWLNPLDDLAEEWASDAAGVVRKIVLVGVAVTGGLALIVLGAWRMAQPAVDRVEATTKDAAGTILAARTGGATKAAGL